MYAGGEGEEKTRVNILVLNGSPRGKNSVTLQTCRYLQLLHPEHRFEMLNVSAQIKALEKDFSAAEEAMERADLLLFSYPVYTFLAPSQLHRFIELMKRAKVRVAGKYATQLTTSKRFYDVTAHRFIQQNGQDMGLKFIRGLSADMDDLLSEQGQSDARAFFDFVMWSVEHDRYEPVPEQLGEAAHCPASVPESVRAEAPGDVAIITDCGREDERLRAMIERFRAVFPVKTRVIDIGEYPFRGGCLGCFGCAASGKCVYTDRFDEFLRSEIQTAQATVYAFSIRDHSMGSTFKMFDDRQFCNGHRTVTMGKPVGYLVSGAYERESNLQTVIEARAQVGMNFLAGVATDEQDTDASIDRMAATLEYALKSRYAPPRNFYGVGGMKIFRDLIWVMQGMMKADHRFYKAHGQYDFPQKQWKTMLKMQLVGALMSLPQVKSRMGEAMNEGIIAPYERLLKSVETEQRARWEGK